VLGDRAKIPVGGFPTEAGPVKVELESGKVLEGDLAVRYMALFWPHQNQVLRHLGIDSRYGSDAGVDSFEDTLSRIHSHGWIHFRSANVSGIFTAASCRVYLVLFLTSRVCRFPIKGGLMFSQSGTLLRPVRLRRHALDQIRSKCCLITSML
jgi:hypothetical protein